MTRSASQTRRAFITSYVHVADVHRASVVLLIGLAAPAAATSGLDWILVTVPLDAPTHGLSIEIDATTVPTSGPRSVGFGTAAPGIHAVHVVPAGHALPTIAIGDSPDIQAFLDASTEPSQVSYSLVVFGNLSAGFEFTALVFVTGATMTDYTSAARTETSDLAHSMETGSGSRAIVCETRCVGATNRLLSAGVLQQESDEPVGIVGAFTEGGAAGLSAHVATRSGAAWRGLNSPAGTFGDPAFAGGAGRWQFLWAGETEGSAAGAYAPIASTWERFAN